MKHSLLALSLALSAAVISVGCAAPASSPAPAAKAPAPAAAPVAKWTCTAPGLVTANYTGGNMAYVHLSGFQTGASYSVVKDPTGKKATGKTGNGTTFVCVTA